MALSKTKQLRFSYLTYMYERLTGKDNSEFHNSIIAYRNNPESLGEDERLFIGDVISYVSSNGLDYEGILRNKDLFMSFDVKKKEGSFFTPARWAREAHRLVVDSVGLEGLKDYVVWDTSCGSGNLLIDFPSCKHIYLSTLNREDIPIVNERFSEREDKQPFTAFQLDFLGSIDTVFDDAFTRQLPDGLQDVLRNKGKLAVIINPPYAVSGTDTVVGDYLSSIGRSDIRFDLFQQFVWQVYNLVNHWGIEDFEFVLMTQAGLHMNKSAQGIMRLLNENTTYGGGFLFPAWDFEGVSKSFVWGISTTHWYRKRGEDIHPSEVLELRVMETDYEVDGGLSDRSKVTLGTTLFPVEKAKDLPNWVKGSAVQDKPTLAYRVSTYGDSVIIDKDGNDVRVGVADDIVGDSIIGYSDVRSNLRSTPMYASLSSLPNGTANVVIRESNFDRLVYYMSYGLLPKSWEDGGYQNFISPVLNDYYYDVYYRGSLLYVLMLAKNFNYCLRGLSTPAGLRTYNSPLFILTDDEVLESIGMNTDRVSREALLADFRENKVDNSFILGEIYKSMESDAVSSELKSLFKSFKGILMRSLSSRRVREGYSLDSAYNLSFNQLSNFNFLSGSDNKELSSIRKRASGIIEGLNRGLTFNYGDKHAND